MHTHTCFLKKIIYRNIAIICGIDCAGKMAN